MCSRLIPGLATDADTRLAGISMEIKCLIFLTGPAVSSPDKRRTKGCGEFHNRVVGHVYYNRVVGHVL